MSDRDLVFEYENTSGKRSIKRLVYFHDRGSQIYGRNDGEAMLKSYSKSRIIRQISGPWNDLPLYVAPPRPIAPPRRPDIVFTGFDTARRLELEAAATAAGYLVRREVSKKLAVLVCGPAPGPSKLRQAAAAGADIIREEDCANLFADGVLPA